MSPILLGIYFDDMLIMLKQCGYGCYIGYVFAGAFTYTDGCDTLPGYTA